MHNHYNQVDLSRIVCNYSWVKVNFTFVIASYTLSTTYPDKESLQEKVRFNYLVDQNLKARTFV